MQSKELELTCRLSNTLCSSSKNDYEIFLSESERMQLLNECIEARSSLDWTFKISVFHHAVCELQYPTIEGLWDLHLLQVMPLETYILFIQDKNETASNFSKNMNKLFTCDFDTKGVEYFVQTGILSFFLQKAFPAVDIFKNSEKRLKEFCLDAVKKFLQDLEAFKIFEDKELSSHSEHLMILLKKLMEVHPAEKVLQILKTTMFDLNASAHHLLSLVKAFVNFHHESSAALLDLLSQNLKEAYESLNYDFLLRTLLILRQLFNQASIAPQISYKKWLQVIFKDCEQLKKLECFSLLIKILTDIVPIYNNAECLKVAIDFNLAVPKEVQQIYNDYIILLKTRVNDLKPQVKAEETVEKIISLYEVLGRIPPVIMEASLLQKHKFINEILPALLTPRVVPHKADVQERLINALYKAGKIPNSLMETYKKKCIEEDQKLTLDIDMINTFEDDSDIIMLD